MLQKIVILYAGQYEIEDKEQNRTVLGTSVSYYFADYFNPIENSNGSKGMRPAKASIDFKLMDKIVKAPAIYNAEMGFKVGGDGKPVITIADLEFSGLLTVLNEDGEVLTK